MFEKKDADGNFTSDLSRFPYIFKSSYFSNKIYRKFVLYHMLIDFASPFPLLLIFNGLLYRSIYISNKIRQTLTTSQRREVNAAKMFSIVALILLLCHTVAVVIFVTTQIHGVTFRELQFIQMVAVTINASINFIIYYAFGKPFRDEFWIVVRACKLFSNKVEQAAVTPSSSTMGTVEMGMTTKTRSVKTSRRGH
ncbi:FMRFamide receptor [Orchesella cincta]|uniref:FMRFamide receptor n=1 Tax=Orchesella cincta TaxID=48709 RepID=A0A1D2NJT7_ORCCI|nr:FMRFamide receptor [Orchesella cincta]